MDGLFISWGKMTGNVSRENAERSEEKFVAVLENTRSVLVKICNVVVKICSVVVKKSSAWRISADSMAFPLLHVVAFTNILNE